MFDSNDQNRSDQIPKMGRCRTYVLNVSSRQMFSLLVAVYLPFHVSAKFNYFHAFTLTPDTFN